VENAVQANVLALLHGLEPTSAYSLKSHEVYNVACGDQTTLNQMVQILQQLTGKSLEPIYGPERPGDVKHSKASISKISKQLIYKKSHKFIDGMKITLNYFTC